MEFDIAVRSTLEFSDGNPIASCSSEGDYNLQLLQDEVDDKEETEEKKNGEKCEGGVCVSSSSSSSNEEEEVTIKVESEAARTRKVGGEVELDEDDDGFRTPTSLDHRIPVIQQCPPAPRKPKGFPTKRKASSSSGRLFCSDLSQEIESLFPVALQAKFRSKIKKARRGDIAIN